jgi:hypothetical protein
LGAAPPIGADEWLSIGQQLEFDPRSLCALAATCREARDAAAIVMRDVKLTALKSGMNRSDICEVFGLTVAQAKALPHALGCVRSSVFTADDVLASLLADGGWRAVSALLAKIASKKRKRDYLEDRRAAAVTKRRATLDAWFDKERPVGADVASVDAWMESLEARGLHGCQQSYAWVRFLFDKALAAPSLVKVKESVKEQEVVAVSEAKIHAEKAARKKALTAALAAIGQTWEDDSPRRGPCSFYEIHGLAGDSSDVQQIAAMVAAERHRKTELKAELAALGLERRRDSSLCDAYERGHPVAGFDTAKRVADEMALLNWLHEYTDYPRAVNKYTDYFYDTGAHNAVIGLAKYRPPATWPWMGAGLRGRGSAPPHPQTPTDLGDSPSPSLAK